MTTQNSPGAPSTAPSIFSNDNFALATKSANTTLSPTSRFPPPSQPETSYREHVLTLCAAYSSLDALDRSLHLPPTALTHAKSLYELTYSYSDLDEQTTPDALIAACMYAACADQNHPLSMPQALHSTQQLLNACTALKRFLAEPAQTRAKRCETERRYRSVVADLHVADLSPHVVVHAKHLYQRAYDSFEDYEQSILLAACFCLACRQLNVPRPPYDICPTASATDLNTMLGILELVQNVLPDRA